MLKIFNGVIQVNVVIDLLDVSLGEFLFREKLLEQFPEALLVFISNEMKQAS